MRLRALTSIVPLSLLSLVACGGDDAPAQAATASAGDAFCKAAIALDAKADEFNAMNPLTMDPADLEKGVRDLVADGERLAAIAPADVQAKAQKAAAAQKALTEKLEALGWDFAAAVGDADFIAASADQKGVGDELDAYVLDKCGVDLTDDASSGSDSSTPAVPAGLVTRDNFLDLYAAGAGVEVTDEMESCFLDKIADISDEDLQGAVSGSGSQDVQTAIGLAIIGCGVPLATGS